MFSFIPTFYHLESQHFGFMGKCLWNHVVQLPPSAGAQRGGGLSSMFHLPTTFDANFAPSARHDLSTFGDREYRDMHSGVFHLQWRILLFLLASVGVVERPLGSRPMCLPQVLLWGCTSSWQPGASWLSSAEVRPVSWMDSLLQAQVRGEGGQTKCLDKWNRGQRLFIQRCHPTRNVERTTPPLSHSPFLFCFVFLNFRTSFISSENEEYVTVDWEFPRALFCHLYPLTGSEPVSFLAPHVLEPARVLDITFISDAKTNEMTMDPFFFVKEKYFDSPMARLLCSWENWSGRSTK